MLMRLSFGGRFSLWKKNWTYFCFRKRNADGRISDSVFSSQQTGFAEFYLYFRCCLSGVTRVLRTDDIGWRACVDRAAFIFFAARKIMKWPLRPQWLSFHVMFIYFSLVFRFLSVLKQIECHQRWQTIQATKERKKIVNTMRHCVIRLCTRSPCYLLAIPSFYFHLKWLLPFRRRKNVIATESFWTNAPSHHTAHTKNELKIWRIDKTRQGASQSDRKNGTKIARFSSFMWMMWRVENDTWHSTVVCCENIRRSGPTMVR